MSTRNGDRHHTREPGRTDQGPPEFNNIFVDHREGTDRLVRHRRLFHGKQRRNSPDEALSFEDITFNQAKVSIYPAENAFISVEAWNNSAVIIHPEETAQASLYLYDQAQGTGAAKIKRKAYKRNQVFNGRETPPE